MCYPQLKQCICIRAQAELPFRRGVNMFVYIMVALKPKGWSLIGKTLTQVGHVLSLYKKN